MPCLKLHSPGLSADVPVWPPSCYPRFVEKLRNLRRLAAAGFSDHHYRLSKARETTQQAHTFIVNASLENRSQKCNHLNEIKTSGQRIDVQQ